MGGTLGQGGRSSGAPLEYHAGGRRLGRRVLAVAVLLSLIVLAAAWYVAADINWIEKTYATRIAPAISIILTRLSGAVPISLAELFVLGLPLVIAFRFARVFWSALQARSHHMFGHHRRHSRPSLLTELGLLAAMVSIGAATFYGAWGLNYARPDLETRLGWSGLADEPLSDELAAIELEALTEQLVEAANSTYVQLHGSVDLGRPSTLTVEARMNPIAVASLFGAPRQARYTIDGALDDGYAVASEELGLTPDVSIPRGRAKAVAASRLMSHLGLAGFYFPWTGEANYNRDMPGFQLPQTIAHEKAHQRGISSEDEANFLAYIAGLRSTSDFARYSAEVFGQRQLFRELIALNPEAAERLLENRYPGVQRDVNDANAYWRSFDGAPKDIQRDVNDAYLKFNGVEEGIDAYAQSARLIVLYARASGGRAMGYLGECGSCDVADAGSNDGHVASAEWASGGRPPVPAVREGGVPVEN